MKLCKNCCIPMNTVVSFSKNYSEKFCRCPKCKSESKHYKIKSDNIVFGEVLNRRN